MEKDDILLMQEELVKCYNLATKLDSLNPQLKGAFTGTPNERIERQLKSFGFFMEQSQNSLTDQLKSLLILANKIGMYDAADYLSKCIK